MGKIVETVLIVKVSNGYLIYENQRESMHSPKDFEENRKVFESKETLFKYLESDLS